MSSLFSSTIQLFKSEYLIYSRNKVNRKVTKINFFSYTQVVLHAWKVHSNFLTIFKLDLPWWINISMFTLMSRHFLHYYHIHIWYSIHWKLSQTGIWSWHLGIIPRRIFYCMTMHTEAKCKLLFTPQNQNVIFVIFWISISWIWICWSADFFFRRKNQNSSHFHCILFWDSDPLCMCGCFLV